MPTPPTKRSSKGLRQYHSYRLIQEDVKVPHYKRKRPGGRYCVIGNFIKNYWVDTYSDEFDKEFEVRTLSEQGFSIGKGSLNLDSLKHRGIEWATLHYMCIYIVMLIVAKTAVEIGDLTLQDA